MIKVSIIVPIYNVEKYLECCLSSLLNQTLNDIEIICIDDGSTDNSSNILQRYKQTDVRIKVLTQANSGQGIARNNAIDIACGEYIGFVDPDDYVSPQMFEILYNQAKAYNADLVEESFFVDNQARNYRRKQKNKLNLPTNIIFNWKIRKNYAFSVNLAVWNKLYRRDFIKKHNIKFMNVLRGEDIIFTVKSRVLAEKILYIDNADYYYRIKEDNSIILNQELKNKLKINRFEYFKMFKQSLLDSNIYDVLEKDYKKWIIKSFIDDLLKKQFRNKIQYLKEIYKFLPFKDFLCLFCRFITISIKNNLFSIHNVYINNNKYKVFIILGFQIKIIYNKCRIR
ncbi:glycosyltransferase [bacterium]|nr:glycosyltransferase [bacterium]